MFQQQHTAGVHSSLVAGVVPAELLEMLKDGTIHGILPTDQAFAADAGIDLATNVSGVCRSRSKQPTLAFTVDGGVMVNDANVTTPDFVTSNGIIHVIDKVLTPSMHQTTFPVLQCTTVHDLLVAAVIQTELTGKKSGCSAFAPTDQAFIDAGIDLHLQHT